MAGDIFGFEVELLIFFVAVRKLSFETLGTSTMSKSGFGMFAYVTLNLVPAAFLIADHFTGRTDRQKPSEEFDLGERLL